MKNSLINKSVTNKSSFRKNALSLVVASSLVISPMTVFAKKIEQTQQQNQQEGLGFGVGMIIGGILGGPAGAFITGLAGSLLVKDNNAKENISALEVALVEQQTIEQQRITQFQQQLQSMEQDYQRELLAQAQNYQNAGQLQAENLLMSLQFFTGSSEIAPHYQAQIKALAKLLQQSPNLMINLAGYTDLQGSEQLNQVLSQARVNSVKTALIDFGIRSERIESAAFGESSPVVAKSGKEVSFYDRRVVITLHSNSDQMAKN
jgi:sortase system peptidoglycan-associated protein